MNRSAAFISERTSLFIPWLLFAACGMPAFAGTLQLVSVRSPALAPPSAANGDSWVHSLSSDGRFVLFASTARNLVSIGSNQPLPSYGLAASDVFLRDSEQRKTELVSVNLAGEGGGNASSIPYGLSTNLQWVLFESSATNLVSGDTNGNSDIFLRDRLNKHTVLASVATNGVAGNGASWNATMTPDARYVAFVSEADNLVPDDTNRIADIFVRDLVTGTTTLASAGAKPLASGSSSDLPLLTADGRYLYFYSTATNLVPGQTNAHIYVRDLVQGTITCVSAEASQLLLAYKGGQNGYSFSAATTEDGQTVVYEASTLGAPSGLLLRYSLATGTTQVIHTNAAVRGADYALMRSLELTPDGRYVAFIANTNGITGTTTCILVWDSQTETFDVASVDMTGAIPADTTCDSITMDATGRYVSFLSDALLTTNSTGDFHLYVRDRQAGTTLLVDANLNGETSSVGPVGPAAMSENGLLIAFECLDGPLAPGDSNSAFDVHMRDLASGTIEMISLRDAAFESLTPDGRSSLFPSALTADGQKVVFVSDAGEVVINDTNTVRDVFLRALVSQTTVLVSVNTNGLPADGVSTEPAISPDGRWVVFTSWADDLVPGDSNNRQDVFLRDLQSGSTTLISVNTNGVPGNDESYSAAVSTDGSSVVFRSQATDLVPGTGLISGANDNLYVRDVQAGVTYALTSKAFGTAYGPYSATPTLSRIAFRGDTLTALYVWDKETRTRIYTNVSSSSSAMTLSPDGMKIALATNSISQSELAVLDIAKNARTFLGALRVSSNPGLCFSGDSKFLVVSAAVIQTGAKSQVYLFDLERGTNTGISRNYETGSPANGNSDMPQISPDGRFIAYRSDAADIVPGDLNGVPDIFLFDRLSGLTVLVTSSQFGPFSADNRSLTPVFSADGRTLAFTSWASDLLPGDSNGWNDVFALSLYSSAAIPLFRASVQPEAQGCCVTWPAEPGKYYRVQFKSSLGDAQWQDLWGLSSVVGNQGLLHEQAPGAAQRFYRVVAY